MLLHTTLVHTCGRPAELVATSKEDGEILFVNVCGPLREDLGAMALGHRRVTVDGAELLDRGGEPHEPGRRGKAPSFSDLARECAFGCSRSMHRERVGR